MERQGDDMKIIGDMAKGKTKFDAAKAAEAARDIGVTARKIHGAAGDLGALGRFHRQGRRTRQGRRYARRGARRRRCRLEGRLPGRLECLQGLPSGLPQEEREEGVSVTRGSASLLLKSRRRTTIPAPGIGVNSKARAA